MQTSHDYARRGKSQRRGREKGCSVYVPMEVLRACGFEGEEPPYFRLWPGRRKTVMVQFYEEE